MAVMVSLHPGGWLLSNFSSGRAIIAKLIGATNWAGLIATLSLGPMEQWAIKKSCQTSVCYKKDVRAPICTLYQYQAFGWSWTWTCYRVYCKCPPGTTLWPPGYGIWDYNPPKVEWDLDKLKEEAEKDWPKGAW